MSPPEGVVVEAHRARVPGPVSPGVLHGHTGQYGGDGGRDHEEDAVDNGADAYVLEPLAGEDTGEEQEDGDLGEDDSGYVGDLRDPSVLDHVS